MFNIPSVTGFRVPLMTYKEFNKRVTDDGGVTEAEICFTDAVLDLQRLNAWNDASLVMIPSGYKDGTLYSVKPTNGDGDFTFTRGSNLAATRVNSEGLIEKGRRICCCRATRLILLGQIVAAPKREGNRVTMEVAMLGY